MTTDLDPRTATMRPFRMLETASFYDKTTGASVSLQQTTSPGGAVKATPEGEDERIQAMFTHLRAALPEGWMLNLHGGVPVNRPAPEDMTPEMYHERLNACVAKLKAAHVRGAEQVLGVPAGWVPVMEEACDGILARMSQCEGVSFEIGQIKEKFGTLRFYAYAEGDDDFVADCMTITDWAENVTDDRCAVTGRPGHASANGWILTLSPEMHALRQEDSKAFSARMYPPRPEIEDTIAGPAS